MQWGTFRKQRAAATNLNQASVNGLGDRVGAYAKNKMWFSNVPIRKLFFARFMEGVHRRVGEDIKDKIRWCRFRSYPKWRGT